MAFMVPVYTKEDFVIVTDRHGDSYCMPAEYFDPREFDEDVEVEVVKNKWWAQLSAPGYMDQTEWSGPFRTKKEAEAEIASIYDVDPETGEDFEENPRVRRVATSRHSGRVQVKRSRTKKRGSKGGSYIITDTAGEHLGQVSKRPNGTWTAQKYGYVPSEDTWKHGFPTRAAAAKFVVNG